MTLSAEQQADLLGFVSPDARPDVRQSALQILESLSADESNLAVFTANDRQLFLALVQLHLAERQTRSATNRIFVNLTASDRALGEALLDEPYLLGSLLDDGAWKAESTAKLLSNLSIPAASAEQIYSRLSDAFLADAVDMLLKVQTSSVGDAIGYVLRNLSQLADCRRRLVLPNSDAVNTDSLFMKLIPLCSVERIERRCVAVDIIRNCCFDSDLHSQLLDADDDRLLVSLVHPLAGPEELKPDENEELPVDLQYLEPTKLREPNLDLRIKLLESLYQLCSTSRSRELLRAKGIYYLLREYHSWEQDDLALRLVGNVIGVLIRTEDEIGVDDLSQIESSQLEGMAVAAD